ncbi:TonB-dependent receptor, partial [Flavobacteriaceae bacterium]|nr:TonB-dependent receptor [Flavobacteriaceae bacterium]
NVSGTIKDEKGNTVGIGDVLLIDKDDNSKILKYTYINEGQFIIENVDQGQYVLHIAALGFQVVNENITLDKNLEFSYVLLEEITSLDEVVVNSKKKIFETNKGRIIANVQNTLLSAEPTTIDVLAKLPGIQVSPDQESISYIGRGNVLIYMGNQRLSTEEMNNLQVDKIKKIEIIKNPSAKYEADGRTLIIITPLRKNVEGYTVAFSETLDFRRNFSNYFGANINAKFNKLELKANFDYNQLQPWESNGFDYGIENLQLKSGYRVIVNTDRPELKGGIGIHYQINNDEYISYNANIRSRNDKDDFEANSFFSQLNQGTQDIRTNNFSDIDQLLFSNNLNYNNKLEKLKGNLFLGVQYSTFNNDSKQTISDEVNEQIFGSFIDQTYSADAFSTRFDFQKTLNDDWLLEVGSKVLVGEAETGFNTNSIQDSVGTESSIYDFKEKNYAFYGQVDGTVKKVNVTAGVRSETTDVRGGFRDSNQNVIDSTYTNWFPKASLNFKVDSTKTMTLNYARSINRPNYSSLNQTLIYINPFVVFQGNFDLRPAISNEYSVSLQYKKITFEGSYTEIKNPSYYLPSYNQGDNLFTMSLQNIEKNQTTMIALSFPYKHKWWSTYNYIAGYHVKLSDSASILGETTPFLYFYNSNEFTLPKGYNISLSGWYISKHNQGIYEKGAISSLDLGVSKTIFKKFKCSLLFSDIFNTTNQKEGFTFNNVKSDGTWFANNRKIAFTLKYSFGKIKGASFKNKDVDNNNRL